MTSYKAPPLSCNHAFISLNVETLVIFSSKLSVKLGEIFAKKLHEECFTKIRPASTKGVDISVILLCLTYLMALNQRKPAPFLTGCGYLIQLDMLISQARGVSVIVPSVISRKGTHKSQYTKGLPFIVPLFLLFTETMP